MNEENPQFRLRKKQRSEQEQGVRQESQEVTFGSVEELLREDVKQTPPPEGIRTRLEDSLRQEPVPRKPWWRRWLG